MKCEILSVERVQEATLPRGNYSGTWSGYVIDITLPTERWLLRTKDGIRGRAEVTVKADGKGQMEVIVDGNPS